jgi:23S rRNA pseudouridine2605 synthase
VLVYHKPLGEVCTRSDPEKRPTIFEKLPPLRNGRWVAVGRLDVNTTGVILLTTDGELANRLMHPSNTVEREYAVRVFGEVKPDILKRLREGVMLEDGLARFNTIVDAGGEGSNHWFHVTLHEGRNREVRRLWETQGITVSRLIRVRYGPVQLGRRLRPGRYEELEGEPFQALLQLVGLARKETRPKEGKGAGEKARAGKGKGSEPGKAPAPGARRTKPRIDSNGEPAERGDPAPRPRSVPRGRSGGDEPSPPPRRAPSRRKPGTTERNRRG